MSEIIAEDVKKEEVKKKNSKNENTGNKTKKAVSKEKKTAKTASNKKNVAQNGKTTVKDKDKENKNKKVVSKGKKVAKVASNIGNKKSVAKKEKTTAKDKDKENKVKNAVLEEKKTAKVVNNTEKTKNVVPKEKTDVKDKNIENKIKNTVQNLKTRVKEVSKKTIEKNKAVKDKKREQLPKEKKYDIKNIFKTKKNIAISVSILIVLCIISAFVIFTIINKKNTKIIKGVSINGIDVSGLAQFEAKEVINNNINKEEMQSIKLKYADYELVVVPEQIEVGYGIDEAVNKAYDVGRDGNIFDNNFNIIKTNIFHKNIEIQISLNDEKLTEVANNIQANIPGAVEESTYSIEGENLVISRGKKGIAVNYEELRNEIIEYEKNISRTEIQEIVIPVIDKDPQPINIEQIHNEIYTEAKDAYYQEEPFQVFPHVLGVDFKISMDEAKQILEQDLEQYIIPLKITVPNITTDKLGNKAFPDLLGKYTTTYASSSANRKYNIARAAGSINGKTLLPGEVFSYNKTIGNPSQSNGYRLATGFANGTHVDSYGGGVCQVSSTLYNAVVYANLDIVSRANHSLPVGYVPVSRDATVYYGAVDFKFKNNRKYPIKIVASASGSSLTVEVYGVKEENDYEVVIESWITENIGCTTKYTNNPNMQQGTERVITKGSNGYRSVAYKILKRNGAVVSRTLLSSDTYNPENREIERGTGVAQVPAVVEEVPAPVLTPEPAPDPTPIQDTNPSNQDTTITVP